MIKENLTIGIDGGGSRCRALLLDANDSVLGQSEAGMANIATDFNQATSSMLMAAESALAAGGVGREHLQDIIVAAGLAGAHLPEVTTRLKAWQHPFANFSFCSDVEAACWAAHRGEDGAIIIVGTGSSAGQLIGEEFNQLGGHGFLLGDQGSGAWLGKRLLQDTLLALDTSKSTNDDAAQVMGTLQLSSSNALVSNFHQATAKPFARFAPVVFALAENGNEIALKVVKQGAAYIEELAQSITVEGKLPLALRGGVADAYQPYLSATLRSQLNDSGQSAEYGAIAFSQQQQNTGGVGA